MRKREREKMLKSLEEMKRHGKEFQGAAMNHLKRVEQKMQKKNLDRFWDKSR